MSEQETIDVIFRDTRVIAVVGLSESPGRASAGVARYLQQVGYRIVPVNPTIETALGAKAYPSLDAAATALAAEGAVIDVVDVFRASTFVPEIVKDVMRLKIKALWLQQGVCHEEASGWAEAAGVLTVKDRCMMQDHAAWKRGA
jgi:predicted CoA-binding protein